MNRNYMSPSLIVLAGLSLLAPLAGSARPLTLCVAQVGVEPSLLPIVIRLSNTFATQARVDAVRLCFRRDICGSRHRKVPR